MTRRHKILVGTCLLGIGAVTALGASGNSTSDTIVSRASVPGIGRVAGYLRPGTRVTSPLKVPRARRITQRELQAEQRLEATVTSTLASSEDQGLPQNVAAVKGDLAEDLFLVKAAVGCDRVPRAALALYTYAFTRPALRPEVDNLATLRSTSHLSQSCRRVRVAIVEWQGVHVTGSKATAMLTGRYEIETRHGWKGDGRVWRVDARRLAGRWKMAILAEDEPDLRD